MTPQRLTAIVAMLLACPVNADELVDRADANGDGYVSLYELRAAHYADMEFNRRIEESFAAYDTDGDGLISEAERQAAAVAQAETAPGDERAASMPATPATVAPPVMATRPLSASGTPPATTAGTATAPAPASEDEPVKEMAPLSAAGRPPPSEVGTTPAPSPAVASADEPVKKMAPISAPGRPPPTAEEAPSAAAMAFTGIRSISELGSPTPSAAGTAATATGPAATADPVSTGTARTNTAADRAVPATRGSARALPDTRRLSRSEVMIQENDTDNSGGASVSELISSGDGSQWFPDRAFTSADKNGDGELDADELEVLLQSMERRRRR